MLGIFLDLETTGLDYRRHRIIDLGFRIVDLSTGEYIRSYQSIVHQPSEVWELRDPVSIEVNGFSEERLKDGLPEEEVAATLVRLFKEAGVARGEAVFICQNPSFDRNFLSQLVDIYEQERLQWPYHWLDLASMYWSLRMAQVNPNAGELPERFSVSKDAIAEYFELPPEEKPHSAMNGVDHLILCYRAVIGLPQTETADRLD